MTETLKPQTAEDTRDLLAWAVSEQKPLEIVGNGTKRGFGHPVAASHSLDLSGLSGIVEYEPAELVLTARAATPISEIEALLRQSNQQLAFEPPDLGPLYGAQAERATLGGIVAGNLSGPRRVQTGAARDHTLGVQVATGRGELIKAGGRVVKNVSGYDLTKLMCGSWGTLGVLTQISIKVLPAPEKTRTVLIAGQNAADACLAMTAALSSPHEVSAAAFLPANITARSRVSYVAGAGASVTAIRIEGPPVSVGVRNTALRDLLSAFGEIEELHGHNSGAFWQEVRDATPFSSGDAVLWRLSVAPASGGAVLDALGDLGIEGYLDWGGGLIWASSGDDVERASQVRTLAESAGGHATLVRAPDALKTSIGVFHPQPATRAGLSQRIKDGFDPKGILNPGRMVQGA
jgi:glycolate oxidase FAD binding subunit